MIEYFHSRKCVSCSANKMVLLASIVPGKKPILYKNRMKGIESWEDMKKFVLYNRHFIIWSSNGTKMELQEFVEMIQRVNLVGASNEEAEVIDGYEFKEV